MAEGVRWFPRAMLMKILPKPAVDALGQTHGNADTKAIGKNAEVRNDPVTGVFDPFDEVLTAQFFENDIEIATCDIRGLLDHAGTEEFTLTEVGATGEATDVTFYGTTSSNTGDSVQANVTHTRSKKTAIVAFAAKDTTVAGMTPGVIGSGGGDISFPPGGGGGGLKIEIELCYQFDIINGRIEI